MLVKKALQYSKEILKKADITTPQLDAEVLLSFILKKSKEWLYTNNLYELSATEIFQYKKLIKHRKNHEPIAYITSQKEFFGLNFYVDKNVFIPRPETEILVETALKIISSRQMAKKQEKLVIADIGTGSGCIAISVTKKLAKIENLNFKIYAIDISQKTLEVAKLNAKNQNIPRKITFLKGNLLLSVPEKVDLILSNPPYVLESEKISPEVKFEPKKAVFVTKKSFFREFIAQIDEKMKKNGICLMEIGNQKKEIQNIIDKNYPNIKVEFINDYSKLPRFAKFIQH
ncbi:peptide chain release factor N(5)-glutamine methyltransferase [bacterium CG_4_10_14_0_2_um_filter_33_32]|nr:MAG: protein-(glutamine-N5) methyltransferase, release factor-specific [bacterium CG2_30_33_46]PIR67598.1 MAG: peptide chain release factor N(5)-glutamine methyltransferase [bacterium CG10_big_fil_rev_8_21_14_0_10_33_18]PIU77153.1 MAG: peptide chain release factor N(5)-glutamine methyltransferase [bacterium CG06_land_8_20_14_3_00_33_50]PIW81374.1 MAG: peptide chain release factor N(5)-glutamine methyltransferase [bacterium CG_4_8_14_3_um_filter_33_28]PIZ85426.1 MAG: peptide chain release fac